MNLGALVIQFESRNLRERILISAAVLSLVWMLWLFAVDSVVADTKVEVTSNINQLAEQLRAGTENQRRIIQTWPERLNLAEQKSVVEDELELMNARIDSVVASAMDPQEVAQLLRTMLAAYSGIELIELRNLTAIEIKVGEEVTGLFRHPLQLTIRGSYAEVVSYVEALESLPSGPAFRSLSYAVDDHPHADVVIEVETISDRRAWFGA